MKRLRRTFHIMAYCIWCSIRHPGQAVCYTVGNPFTVPPQSPVPWVVSVGVVFMGIASWCIGEKWDISGLAEASRAMVYIPLSYMFGKSSELAKTKPKNNGEEQGLDFEAEQRPNEHS